MGTLGDTACGRDPQALLLQADQALTQQDAKLVLLDLFQSLFEAG